MDLEDVLGAEPQLHDKRYSAHLKVIFVGRECAQVKDEISFPSCQPLAAWDNFNTCMLGVFSVVPISVLEATDSFILSGKVIQKPGNCGRSNKLGIPGGL